MGRTWVMAHGGGEPRAAERRENTLRVTQLVKVVGRRGGWMGGWMHGGLEESTQHLYLNKRNSEFTLLSCFG